MASIKILETPKARSDAVSDDRPAWAKRSGAYYMLVSCDEAINVKKRNTHVENNVNPRELHYAQNKQSKHRPRTTCLSE